MFLLPHPGQKIIYVVEEFNHIRTPAFCYYRVHPGSSDSSHPNDVNYGYPTAEFVTQKESLKKLKQQQVARYESLVWLDGKHHH